MYISVTLDCADPESLAEFWAQVLDYRRDEFREPYLMLRPKDGNSDGPPLCLQRVAEPKQGKNRMHLDLNVDDVEESVARLIALGATRRSGEVLYGTHRWFVLADPEGNEFCVIGHTDEYSAGDLTSRCSKSDRSTINQVAARSALPTATRSAAAASS